jgi:hypothetical protein
MQAIVCRLSVVGCQLVNSEFGEDDWGAWNTDKCTETGIWDGLCPEGALGVSAGFQP